MVEAILTTVILIILLLLAIPYLAMGAIWMAIIYIVDKVNEFLR